MADAFAFRILLRPGRLAWSAMAGRGGVRVRKNPICVDTCATGSRLTLETSGTPAIDALTLRNRVASVTAAGASRMRLVTAASTRCRLAPPEPARDAAL